MSSTGSTRFTEAESISDTFNGMLLMPSSAYPSGGLTSFKVYDQLNLLTHQYGDP